MQKQSVFSSRREYARIKNEQMSPRRKKFNKVGIILLIAWSLLTIGGACVCMGIDSEKLWWIALLCLLATIGGVGVILVLKNKIDYYETVDELESLSYLFKKSTVEDDETLEVEGLEEDGVDFVLSKAGLRVKLREGGEQVFGDGMDDGKFYAWEDLDLFLAASNEFYRVNLGLAVMSKQPAGFIDEAESSDEDEIFYILPMCKNLALALRSFCMEYLTVDWMYVFHQPLDAFLQIMKKGRIENFYNAPMGEDCMEENNQEQFNE